MRKIISALVLLILSHNIYATQNDLVTKGFSENEVINLTLSSKSFNRLFVKGDKIINVQRPDNTVELNQKALASGAVYILPLTTQPFHVFFDTLNGHHFSAIINSKPIIGKVVELVPESSFLKEKRWETQSYYTMLLEKIMNSVINHKVLPGFNEISVNESYHTYVPNTKMNLLTLYNGSYLSVYHFDVVNVANHTIHLFERYFYRDGVRAVNISKTTLKSGEHTNVYVIEGNKNG